MRTAVDSSVLLRILKREEGWTVWRDAISRASTEGSLLICPVVFAECSVGFASTGVATERFEALQLQFDPILPESAYLAGQTFLRYRREGGPRLHLIPDFLIAAHASIQADRLAAEDRGYLRRYFDSLPLVVPD
jgi:predicted nucleic acid-binding protein